MLEFLKLTLSFMTWPIEVLEYMLNKRDEPGFKKFQASQRARLRRMAGLDS